MLQLLKISAALLALFVGLGACVSKSKHQKALDKIEGLQADLIKVAKDKGQLQNTLEEVQRALDEMKTREIQQKKRLQDFRDLTQKFKKLIDAGTLSVRIVDGKMVVSLGSDVLFPSGSARLSPQGALAIKDVTAKLQSLKDKRYQVEGHTDNVPISTARFPSNWELSVARALNVVQRMMKSGMPATRVSAAGFADSQPVASNGSKEGKASNRRIEIVIVPDLSTLPGYKELQELSEKQSKGSFDNK